VVLLDGAAAISTGVVLDAFRRPGSFAGGSPPLNLSDDRHRLIAARRHLADEVVQPMRREALNGDIVAVDRLEPQRRDARDAVDLAPRPVYDQIAIFAERLNVGGDR
jgi:hypothetical protein